jgi:enoyl-CoA hydratase/carnithine racemase
MTNSNVHEAWTFASLSIEAGIATVEMNRPERMNALHPPAHRELSDIFDALATDAAVRVVIVTGRGADAFCAGYDLKDNLETGRMELPTSGFGGLNDRAGYPHPLIAAVNGVAFGGGFEMALTCDMIVAAPHARFALPEPKVGWAALGGGVQRLSQAVGIKRAMDIILTGRSVAAEEAYALGLVSEIATGEEVCETAKRWAQKIAACAPLAIRASREVAFASQSRGGAVNLVDHPIVREMLESADAIEGKRAFFEKRAPVWKGR